MMQILAIRTRGAIYVTDNTKLENPSYWQSAFRGLLVNGEKASATNRNDWYKIPAIPSAIQRQLADKRVNGRYELKAGYPESELTPKIIIGDVITSEESSFYEVRGLYDFKFDTEPGGLEDVPFEVTIISEAEDFKIVKESFPVQYGLLDQITLNPALLPTKPCKISAEQFYRILREHVRRHIDPKVARITSDYDFCLTVTKSIPIEPEPYLVDMGTKKRPRNETRYHRDRSVVAYECAPKPYQSYTVLQPMSGSDYEDLKTNIDSFLEDVMHRINEPLKECPHCKGRGVIETK